MKQFAITIAAIFAATAFAQADEEDNSFSFGVSYEDGNDMFLGLDVGNPVTVKLPKSCFLRQARAAGLECSGWQLGPNVALQQTDFLIEEIELQGRRDRVISALKFTGQDETLESAVEIQLQDTCAVDDEGNAVEKYAYINVQTYLDDSAL